MRLLFIPLLCLYMIINAGQNENATVFIDHDFRNNTLEISGNTLEESESCYIAVNAKNVKELHSYSFKIAYDQNIVKYENAAKTANFGEVAFLESTKGKIAAFLPFEKHGEIEIAVTLSGKDISVGGDGVLAYLKFLCIKTGDPQFKVTECKFVNKNGSIDLVK